MNALHTTHEAMSRVLFLSTLTVALALTGCASQAPAPCQIQPSGNGPYTIKMTNTGTVSASCPAVMGDQWFFDNYANGLIAMVSSSSAIPFPPDPTSSIYGRGKFSTSDPDSNDLCTLPTVNTFDGPKGSTYSVKNLSFLSTALYIGTQWKGDITYTPAGGSPCTYSAQAINPSTQCASNADCNPTSQPVNSGINYLYDQGCNKEDWATAITGDPATGICFFNKPFPSLGGFTP
jgi:hypothetical protein